MDDLLDFLARASNKGLMPAATARALAVAARNVFGVLDESEQKNIGALDPDAIIKRFNNKRAKDFNPASLREYDRRIRRAIELYEQWRENPADFSVKTRSARKSPKRLQTDVQSSATDASVAGMQPAPNRTGAYQSSFPVGPGRIVTLTNIPDDLTQTEAEKLAQFIRLLAID